ncbi:hypothetical protein D9M69_594830 [compost metagenome]
MALVLDDYRAAVLVQAQGVDAAFVGLAGGVLAGEKAHAEKALHLCFDQVLQLLFHCDSAAGQFVGGTIGTQAKQLDIAHAACSCSSLTSPRTSIWPVTAEEIRAVRRSLSKSIALSASVIRASNCVSLPNRNAAIFSCSPFDGKTPNTFSRFCMDRRGKPAPLTKLSTCVATKKDLQRKFR